MIIMVIIHRVHEFIPGEHAIIVRIEHFKCHFWSHLLVMVITMVITVVVMVITMVIMVITVVSMISVSATAFFSDVLDIITCGIL